MPETDGVIHVKNEDEEAPESIQHPDSGEEGKDSEEKPKTESADENGENDEDTH